MLTPLSYYVEVPPGRIYLCFTREYGIYRLFLPGSKPALGELPEPGELSWPELEDDLKKYFGGTSVEFRYPLDLSGWSTFARKVMGEVLRISHGSTRSYGEVASRAGVPGGARAVGRVMAGNPVPLLIPCHRVIRSDGSPGGFTSGASWKEYLLNLEKTGRL